MVRLLLGAGAEVDSVDCVGQTPLFYAVTNSQAEHLVPMLIEAGLTPWYRTYCPFAASGPGAFYIRQDF